jgi:hypothetical protein
MFVLYMGTILRTGLLNGLRLYSQWAKGRTLCSNNVRYKDMTYVTKYNTAMAHRGPNPGDTVSGQDMKTLRPAWLVDKILRTISHNSDILRNRIPLVIDFSAHTRCSPGGALTPRQLVMWEVLNGYDGVVITDHATCKNVDRARRAAAEIAPGFTVISGLRPTQLSKNSGMCICGANTVPWVIRLYAIVFGDTHIRSLLSFTNRWAGKQGLVIYNDTELGCSCLYDPIQKTRICYTVVYVDQQAWKGSCAAAVMEAVKQGYWNTYVSDENANARLNLTKRDRKRRIIENTRI